MDTDPKKGETFSVQSKTSSQKNIEKPKKSPKVANINLLKKTIRTKSVSFMKSALALT